MSINPSQEHPEFFWGGSPSSLRTCNVCLTVLQEAAVLLPRPWGVLSTSQQTLVYLKSGQWWVRCSLPGLRHLDQWYRFEERRVHLFTPVEATWPHCSCYGPSLEFLFPPCWGCLGSRTNFLIFLIIFFPLSRPTSVAATCKQRTLTSSFLISVEFLAMFNDYLQQ